MIRFCNNGLISLMDITTMGDSCKRDDDSKIGKFDSGLKYAIAILYRNGVKTTIKSGGVSFNFSTTVVSDELTSKRKELLVVNYNDGEDKTQVMSFSPNLGHEWETWMAIRELYSNCIDEGGKALFGDEDVSEYETIICLEGSDLLETIIERWDSYFIPVDKEPLLDYYSVKTYKNNEEHLKFYKNGILILEDTAVKSLFSYDYENAKIDEMRVLSDRNNFSSQVCSSIQGSSNKEFIGLLVDGIKENTYEASLNFYSFFSKEWHEVVNKKYAEGSLSLPQSILTEMAEDASFNIGQRRLSYDPGGSYYKTTIKVADVEGIVEDGVSFEDKIKRICASNNFDIKHPIIKSSISKYKCIPDLRKKCVYVTEDFEEADMWEMVKAVFRIDSDDKIDYVYQRYAELMSK